MSMQNGVAAAVKEVQEKETTETSTLLKKELKVPTSVKRQLLRASSQLHSFHSLVDREDARLTALEHPGVGKAAFLIRDAVLGTTESSCDGAYDPYQHPECPRINAFAILCRHICSSRAFRHFKYVVLCVLVLLSFIEPPMWCRYLVSSNQITNDNNDHETWTCQEYMSARGPPAGGGEEEFDYYPNTSTTFLTVQQSNFVELGCLLCLWIFIGLRIGRDGLSLQRYLRPGPARLVHRTEFATLSFLTIGLMYDIFTVEERKRILAPYFRIILFIAADRDCIREFYTLLHMLPEVANVLFLLFLFVSIYAWVGVVAFYGSDEGVELFPNILDAMFTLWIATTTANYPDLMMPVYNKNRLSTLYFVIFMLVTFFFLMNVILASVVNAYDNELERRRDERSKLMDQKLGSAFELMDRNSTGTIDRETVMALMLIMNEDFHEFRTIPPDEAKLLFAILDKDGSNSISKDEFMDFANVLLLEFEKITVQMTLFQKLFPTIFHSSRFNAFRNFLESNTFEFTIDFILMLNAIVVFIQSYPMLMGQTVKTDPHIRDGEIDSIWEVFETVFTCIYVVEISVKILVKGWHEFLKSSRNIFDMTITCLAVLATVYVYYPNEFSDSRLIRFIVMARVLRLTRLLMAMAPFQMIALIAIDVFARAKVILVLLFCVCYIFAVFGVQVFGGMITRDPADPRSFLLLGTEFAANHYWANNFNDMFGALNVLFNLLVVNNWTECQCGFEAVTQTRYNRLFFVLFHIVGVMLVNNLVLAFIINAFIKQWDFRHEKLKTHIIKGEAVIVGRRALFDATKVTGTKTDLSGLYAAKIGQRTMFDEEHQQRMLRSMFTSSSSASLKETSKNGSIPEHGKK